MGGVRGPCWGCVVRVHEEVHVDKAKDKPVVAAVLEQVEKWHGIV